MFRIYFTNFYYYMSDEFDTLEKAKAAGKRAYFDFTVYKGRDIVGTWSAFNGWREVHK